MKRDYTALDNAICDAIATNRLCHPINHIQLCDSVRLLVPGYAGVDWRLIDRRMQAMKNNGRILFTRRTKNDHGWRVSNGHARN